MNRTGQQDDGFRMFIGCQIDKVERSASDIISFCGRIRSLSELEGDDKIIGWINLACERCIESERALRECLEWLAKLQNQSKGSDHDASD